MIVKSKSVQRRLAIQCPLESAEAKTFWAWAQYHHIAKEYLSHIANETKTSFANGKHLKDQGKRKGISDYILPYPCNGKAGLWVELKRRDKTISKLTPEQAIWLDKMERVGYATRVAYGADEAIQAVEDYLR